MLIHALDRLFGETLLNRCFAIYATDYIDGLTSVLQWIDN